VQYFHVAKDTIFYLCCSMEAFEGSPKATSKREVIVHPEPEPTMKLEQEKQRAAVAITVSDVTSPMLQGPVLGTRPSVRPSIDLERCPRAIAISNISRDELLSSDEYVRFVNRLSDNQWVSESYDTLPFELQDNFVQLADGTGQIPVFGFRPGQTPTTAQQEQLDRVCMDTARAIDAALNGPPLNYTSAPTLAPSTASPTCAPTTSSPTTALSNRALVPTSVRTVAVVILIVLLVRRRLVRVPGVKTEDGIELQSFAI
jgi:hypothetical protein